MEKLEFEYWVCMNRTLFSPANDIARLMCKTQNRKNLIENDIILMARMGYPVRVRPKNLLSPEMQKLVRHE